MSRWPVIYGVILLLVMTPMVWPLTRGPYSRWGIRQKTPWLVALGLVMVFVGAPLALAGVVSSTHPRNEARYIQDLLTWRCNALAHGCDLATGLTKPYRDKIRSNPATYIAAGDKACAWLADRPPLVLFSPRAETRQTEYVEHILGPSDWRSRGYISNRRDFAIWETRYAWRDLCPGTTESRTGYPLRHWKTYS
jgi:hypothetical protein